MRPNSTGKDPPLVSIVIPCFNAACYLEETLQSVWTQTFKDYEVIAVDDGSTDGTARLLQAHKSRLRVISTPSNRGASAARNLGTQAARGRYIQYLDADDLLMPETLAQRLETLERTGADVAHCPWQFLNETRDGRFFPARVSSGRLSDFPQPIEISLLNDFWFPPAAALVRRSAVEGLEWPESLAVLEDVRFWSLLAARGARFEFVPETGAMYRRPRRHRTLSNRVPRLFAIGQYLNARDAEQRWRRNEPLADGYRAALVRAYAGVADKCLDTRAFSEWRDACARLDELRPDRSAMRWFRASKFLGANLTWALARMVRLGRETLQRVRNRLVKGPV